MKALLANQEDDTMADQQINQPIGNPNPGQQVIQVTMNAPNQAGRNYTTMASDKSRKTALLLCIFFGFFGAHQFYVGRMGKGILYFFTCGLFVVGWILDIFQILLRSFKDNVGAPLRQ